MMTYEHKFAAIRALRHFSNAAVLWMSRPGCWHVSNIGAEIKDGSMLKGVGGSGSTPEAAIEDCWKEITDERVLLIIDAFGDRRRAVRWNGYMWQDVPE